MAGWTCTDREEIEWDGTIHVRNALKMKGNKQPRIFVQSATPVSPDVNDLWVDTT